MWQWERETAERSQQTEGSALHVSQFRKREEEEEEVEVVVEKKEEEEEEEDICFSLLACVAGGEAWMV